MKDRFIFFSLDRAIQKKSLQQRESYYDCIFHTPKIIKVNSRTSENFKEVIELIEEHEKFLEESRVITSYQKNRIKNETIQILKHKITKKVEGLISSNSTIDEYIRLVMDKSLDPYSMANLIIKLLGLE